MATRSRRKLRNYLLDKKFQLKYTGIVLGLTTFLSAALGYFLQREIVTSQNTILARNLSSDTYVISPAEPAKLFVATEEVTNRIHEEVAEASSAKLAVIVSINNAPDGTTADLYQDGFESEVGRRTSALAVALVVFLVVLALFWVYLTHRIAGPVYKLRLLFSKIDRENVKVDGSLRRGDELQDTFAEFKAMVERLRDDRREKAGEIGRVIEELETASVDEAQLEKLRKIQREILASIPD